jgi:hypothetical protein
LALLLIGLCFGLFLGLDLMVQTLNSFASNLALTSDFDEAYLEIRLSTLLDVSRNRLIEIKLSMALSAMK